MRKLIISFGIAAAASVSACADSGRSSDPSDLPSRPAEPVVRLSAATYNVHRLFDTVCDSNACGGRNYEPAVDERQYDSDVLRVAKGIYKIDADIVLLQEIEKESSLPDIIAKLPNSGYADYAFGESGYAGSVDVAILTRGKIDRVVSFTDGYDYVDPNGRRRRMSRELIAAEMTMPGGIEVTAFTTHFVSKYSDPEGGRRLAESVYTEKVLAEYIAAHPGRFVIFGGDLNDTPGSAPINALDQSAAVVRDTRDMPPEMIYTWQNEAAFDHLYHSPGSLIRKKTQVVCDGRLGRGLSGSDHCGLLSTYEMK